MKIRELQDELKKLRLTGVSGDCEINIAPVRMGERRKTAKGVAFDEVSVERGDTQSGRPSRHPKNPDEIIRRGIVYVEIGDV